MQYYIYTLFHTSSSMCPRNYLTDRARSCGVSTHRCRTLPPVSACPPATDVIRYWAHPRLGRSYALLPAYSSGRARLLTVVHALLRPCVLRRAVSAELLPYSVEPPLRLVPARAHARGEGPAPRGWDAQEDDMHHPLPCIPCIQGYTTTQSCRALAQHRAVVANTTHSCGVVV